MERPGNDYNPSQETPPPEQSPQLGNTPTGSGLPAELQRRLRTRHPSFASSASQLPLETLTSLLESDSWSERVAAVHALGRLKAETPVDQIARAMQDEHEAVRAAAARVLGKCHEHAPLGHLIPALHDESWKVRAAAVQALGKLGKRVPPGLMINAIYDEDEAVRAAAAGALGEIGNPEGIEALLVALQDSAWHVREMAVLALGSFGMQAPVEALAIALKDPDRQVREAVEALNETQPALFRAIQVAQRTMLWQEQHREDLLALSRRQSNTNVSSQQRTLARKESGPYPRRGKLRILRQTFLASWCLIIGYLGGCAWYLLQQMEQLRAGGLATLLGVLTLGSVPIGTTMPAWAHGLLVLSGLCLCAGACLALGDTWLERLALHRKKHEHRAQHEPIDADLISAYQGLSARQRITRRVALAGLSSLVVAGNGVAWSLLLQKGQKPSTAPGTRINTIALAGGALALAWSPDSKQLVTGGNDATVQIYRSITGELEQSYTGHQQAVLAVAWSPGPTGRFIASGSADATVHVWEAATKNTRIVYQGHTQSVIDLAWSHDGTRIISSSQDGSVHIWEALTGKLLQSYTGTKGDIANVAWSPDGRYIAIIGLRQQLWIIEARSGAIVYQQPASVNLSDSGTSGGHSIGWSPDSSAVAFSDHLNGGVQVIKVSTGKVIATYTSSVAQTMNGHYPAYLTSLAGAAGNVVWSPNGLQIATAKRDKKVEVWEVSTGKQAFTCHSSSYYLFSIAWSPNGSYIAATCWDNPALVVWKAV